MASGHGVDGQPKGLFFLHGMPLRSLDLWHQRWHEKPKVGGEYSPHTLVHISWVWQLVRQILHSIFMQFRITINLLPLIFLCYFVLFFMVNHCFSLGLFLIIPIPRMLFFLFFSFLFFKRVFWNGKSNVWIAFCSPKVLRKYKLKFYFFNVRFIIKNINKIKYY